MGPFSRRSVLEAFAGITAVPAVGGARGVSSTADVDPTAFPSVGERDRGAWGTYHGNRRRTGYVPDGTGPEANPRIEWLFETGFTGGDGSLRQQHPIVRDGVAYAFAETSSETTADSGSFRLAAIDLETGSESWRVAPEVNGATGPLATDDRSLYLNSLNGVLSLGRTDGEVEWVQDDFFPTGGPVSVGEEVYSIVEDRSTGEGLVVALDAGSGERLWNHPVGEVRSAASPAYADGTIYAATGRGGRLYAIDVESRSEEWVFEIDGDHDFQGSVPAIAPGEAYVASQERLFSIDADAGEERWSVESGNSWNAPAVTGERVLHSESRGLVAYDRESGSELWRTRRFTGPESSSIAVGDTAYLHDGFTGEIGAFDLETGERRWRFPLGSHNVRADLSFHDGRLLLNVAGRVFAIVGGDVESTPTATATHDPDRPAIGREVTFDASGSGGEIDRYLWNLSGGLFRTGEEATYAYEYDTGGNRQYSLLVIDENGRTDAVYSEALAPNAEFSVTVTGTNGPIEAGAELEVSFDVTNDGDAEAARTIDVSADGIGSTSVRTRLDSGETSAETATLATDSESVGTFDVAVDSGTDGDSISVTVSDPAAESGGGDATDGTGGSGSEGDDATTDGNAGDDTAVDGTAAAGTVLSPVDSRYLLGAGTLAVLATGGALFRRSQGGDADGTEVDGLADDGDSAGDPSTAGDPSPATGASGSHAGGGAASGGDADPDDAASSSSDPEPPVDLDDPAGSVEAIRTGLAEAANAAESAEEDGDLDAAVARYERAVRTYDDPIERLDGPDAAELAAALDDVKAELHAVRTRRRARDTLRETLRSAEKSLREAIDAHVEGRSTLSKLRYRQARDRFGTALDAIDDADANVPSSPIEVSPAGESDLADAPLADLPGVSDGAAGALSEAGFETVADLYAANPAADDESGDLAAALDSARGQGDLEASAVSRLTALSWRSDGDTTAFGDRADVERRRDRAATGFDATR
ncbi:outer membrane protein assembly factor BamB family protein [Halorubrum cibi]|uniref:Outer membrane protein assembly factor BamB, contains PQQ-like beta-propeller repeat n=1 Tax=Halorubrum cibi TaxID=413815 RepID=A0A521CHL3_9EURY|nr:PQQ-binding-like beta-propeller repeat protein [Halorubrum cibi]SMO58902.1 Outer membrane protein assembly factor BamB, contains PQQ-like beta-propeller repeat [Halorubrum cibi]